MSIAVALLLACAVGVVAPNPRDPRLLNPIVQDSVFVKWRPGTTNAGSASAAAAGGGDPVRLASGGAISAAPVRPKEQPASAAARLRNLPGVEATGLDFWVHAQGAGGGQLFPYEAPYKDKLWNESWGMHRISAGFAWGRGVKGADTGATAPQVCLIDSGVDCDHPDLQGVCKFGKSFLTDGKKTKQQDGLKAVRDEHGHGTMMAGLIAARNNDVGSVGVLQNGVALHVCKFMDADGFGRMIDARLCLDWCLKQRTHISVAAWGVNIYGLKWRCNDTLSRELSRRGRRAEAEEWRCDDPAGALHWEFKGMLEAARDRHVMVAAAGNDGRRLLDGCPSYFWMPSQMRASNMLVVTASDYHDNLWRAGGAGPPRQATCDAMRGGTTPGGNYGADWVHLAAPGKDVWTTRMRTEKELKDKKMKGVGTYIQVSGTSAAAALAAGGLGLIQCSTGNDAADLMAQMLLEGADTVQQLAQDAGDGAGPPVAGGRRLNVFNPLVAIAQLFGLPGWQRLPPDLCGLAPESTMPPITGEPAPPESGGVGSLNDALSPPPPPTPKPRPPPPKPKPRPPPPKPRPPPPKPKPRPTPPKPKPRPPPPKPMPRPPPPGCEVKFYWNGRQCVTCASRWGGNCALCTPQKCTLSCPQNKRNRPPCSQYYPVPARRG